MTNIEQYFTEESVWAIIAWAESAKIPTESFKMPGGGFIHDPVNSFAVDLNIAKKNYPDNPTLYKPAILRLNRWKMYLQRN